MSTTVMDQIRHLSVEERIRLVQEIWDTIEADSPAPPFPDSQRDEIRRRVEAYRQDPSRVVPADEVFRELEELYG